MFCKNCGSEITGNMRFCNNCGAELPPPEAPPADNMYTQMPQSAPVPPPQNMAMPPPQNVAMPYAPPQNMPGPGQFPQPHQKKGSTGLIITAIAIAMVVLIGGIVLFAFRDSIFGSSVPTPSPTPSRGGVVINPGTTDTPTPSPQQPPSGGTDAQLGAELEGSWGNGSGDWIYYFHEAANIQFILTGDGEGRVHEDEWGEWGDWWIDSDGFLHIIGDFDGEYDIFTYVVRGNTLTIYDVDRDSRTYTR